MTVKERYYKRKAADKCTNCGGKLPKESGVKCDKCSKIEVNRQVRHYNKRKLDGICVKCRHTFADYGTMCLACSQSENKRRWRYRQKDQGAAKKRAAGWRKKFKDEGRCYCGKPLHEEADAGHRCCINCREDIHKKRRQPRGDMIHETANKKSPEGF